jgi:hypothetical protein
MAQQSNLNRSKEDDFFSNLTVSQANVAQMPNHHLTPTSIYKNRMNITPLYVPGYPENGGRATAQRVPTIPL